MGLIKPVKVSAGSGDGTSIYTAEIYTQGGHGVPVTVSEPDEQGRKCLTIDAWMDTNPADIVSGKKAVTNEGIVDGSHVCSGGELGENQTISEILWRGTIGAQESKTLDIPSENCFLFLCNFKHTTNSRDGIAYVTAGSVIPKYFHSSLSATLDEGTFTLINNGEEETFVLYKVNF